jgi:hypothetical protein
MKPSHSLTHSLTHSLIWKSMSPYLLLGVFTPAKLGKKNEKKLKKICSFSMRQNQTQNTAIELLQWTSLFFPFRTERKSEKKTKSHQELTSKIN